MQRNRFNEAQAKINRAMTDGVGGLKFTAQAPPGIGRLIRIPFYLDTAAVVSPTDQMSALDGLVPAGQTSQVFPGIYVNVAALVGAAAGSGVTARLHTPRISWAVLRIVGFECVEYQPSIPTLPLAEIAFADLKIGGGATLFVHEDFGPAAIYLAGQDSFAGLRDYPILKSPNVAEVSAQAVAGVTGVASVDIAFSASLVCEILTDDNYGAHVPGPYARAGAIVRQGGSFVNR